MVRGDSLENLKFFLEGSPKLVSLVRERLGMDATERPEDVVRPITPHVFLSYTADNVDVAERVAEALQAADIETWWDRWCIYRGDSCGKRSTNALAAARISWCS